MIEQLIEFFDKHLSKNILKIIISNKQSGKFRKIDIIKTGDIYHVSKYTEKQVFNENLTLENLRDFLIENIDNFKQYNFFNENQEYMAKVSKKGKIFTSHSTIQTPLKLQNSHNKIKNYIIPEGSIVPPLVDMGIMNKDGKIISASYNKFKQINKVLEIIDKSIKELNLECFNIIDFGCGKSYLTFILYYYLIEIKHKNANIVGLDLKEDVIKNCNLTAQKYGYKNLKFYVGNIKDYEPTFSPDIVVTLHACDTATDYALYNAINWNTKLIFSVPCCQHELNTYSKYNNLKIFERYGIAKERLSAIFTDIIRCNLLEYSSYKVDLLEFVDIADTPKNLLIRAKLSKIPTQIKTQILSEVNELQELIGHKQTLYNLIIK
ncbi:MAG: SAM-dependent methyltransferase [Clostridiales bacterium]|nr:SAM-dependent methyltransferase [Clostridiales bacterium]